jgi:hypothetical protein
MESTLLSCTNSSSCARVEGGTCNCSFAVRFSLMAWKKKPAHPVARGGPGKAHAKTPGGGPEKANAWLRGTLGGASEVPGQLLQLVEPGVVVLALRDLADLVDRNTRHLGDLRPCAARFVQALSYKRE